MPKHKNRNAAPATDTDTNPKAAKHEWTLLKQKTGKMFKEWKASNGPAVPCDGRMTSIYKPGPVAAVAALESFAHSPSVVVSMITIHGFVDGNLVAACDIVLSCPAKSDKRPSAASVSNMKSLGKNSEYGMQLMHEVKTWVYHHNGQDSERPGPGQTPRQRHGPAPKIHVVVPVDCTSCCLFWAGNGFVVDDTASPVPSATGVGMTFDFKNSADCTRQ